MRRNKQIDGRKRFTFADPIGLNCTVSFCDSATPRQQHSHTEQKLPDGGVQALDFGSLGQAKSLWLHAATNSVIFNLGC